MSRRLNSVTAPWNPGDGFGGFGDRGGKGSGFGAAPLMPPIRGKRCATPASATIQRDTWGAVRDLHGGLCKRPGRVPPGLGSGTCVDKKTGTRAGEVPVDRGGAKRITPSSRDRKSTRLNSSHSQISYA